MYLCMYLCMYTYIYIQTFQALNATAGNAAVKYSVLFKRRSNSEVDRMEVIKAIADLADKKHSVFRPPSSEPGRNTFKGFKRCFPKNGSSQGQNLALTVLIVPFSSTAGCEQKTVAER